MTGARAPVLTVQIGEYNNSLQTASSGGYEDRRNTTQQGRQCQRSHNFTFLNSTHASISPNLDGSENTARDPLSPCVPRTPVSTFSRASSFTSPVPTYRRPGPLLLSMPIDWIQDSRSLEGTSTGGDRYSICHPYVEALWATW
jgi:hypothetical protein